MSSYQAVPLGAAEGPKSPKPTILTIHVEKIRLIAYIAFWGFAAFAIIVSKLFVWPTMSCDRDGEPAFGKDCTDLKTWFGTNNVSKLRTMPLVCHLVFRSFSLYTSSQISCCIYHSKPLLFSDLHVLGLSTFHPVVSIGLPHFRVFSDSLPPHEPHPDQERHVEWNFPRRQGEIDERFVLDEGCACCLVSLDLRLQSH